MDAFPDPLPLPTPAWLLAHSEPNIDDVVEQLDDETRRLYRRYLADEVRADHHTGMHPALRALDRTTLEIRRRNKERHAP
jgi:hypothetical protein